MPRRHRAVGNWVGERGVKMSTITCRGFNKAIRQKIGAARSHKHLFIGGNSVAHSTSRYFTVSRLKHKLKAGRLKPAEALCQVI